MKIIVETNNPKEPWPHHLQLLWGKRKLYRKHWMFHPNDYQRGCRIIQEYETSKSGNKNPGGGRYKIFVNFEYTSCSLMMGISAKEWDDIPYLGIMFYQTSSQAVLQLGANKYEAQESSSHNNTNYNIMRVLDIILDDAAEAGIDKNWCLLDNQSTCNAFIVEFFVKHPRCSWRAIYTCPFQCRVNIHQQYWWLAVY